MCFAVVKSKVAGRSLAAKSTLKAGSVVIAEQPFVSVLSKTLRDKVSSAHGLAFHGRCGLHSVCIGSRTSEADESGMHRSAAPPASSACPSTRCTAGPAPPSPSARQRAAVVPTPSEATSRAAPSAAACGRSCWTPT